MGTIATSWVQVHPSFMEPGLVLTYSQASGAFATLASGNPLVRLGSEDLYVYMRSLDIRTKIAAGQSAFNMLPSVGITTQLASTPSYLLRVRAEYDHHDSAQMSNWGAPIAEAYRLGMRQAHFQLIRNNLLYGMNPANGEGLLNAAGITVTTLPADSFGNDTVETYDNGQMAMYLLSVIAQIKTRTNQLGTPRRFVILGPQETLAVWELQGIVQLTQYQRPGAGTDVTAGVVKKVMEENGDVIEFQYDDTLINQGANGTTNAVLVVMPEVDVPKEDNVINTNEFALVEPGIRACTALYADLAAPREIPTPIPGGAIDIVSEMRTTSGWAIRPEVVTKISMQQS